MNYWMVFIGFTLLYAAFTFFQGSRKYKETQRIEESVQAQIPHFTIGKANYQGGFPPMPKLAKVTLGIADDNTGLVMYDKNGTTGKIEFVRIMKTEKFTTKKDPDLKGRSVVLYGPLVPFIFRPKISHFCIVNYIDINDEQNNLVFHSTDKQEIDRIYKSLDESWKSYKKKPSNSNPSEDSGLEVVHPNKQLPSNELRVSGAV